MMGLKQIKSGGYVYFLGLSRLMVLSVCACEFLIKVRQGVR